MANYLVAPRAACVILDYFSFVCEKSSHFYCITWTIASG